MPSPCRALILEDDRDIARLFQTILVREGFTVQLTTTRSQAIEQISSDHFHLIVLDLMVPDHKLDVIQYIKLHHLALLKALVVVSADAQAIAATLRGEYPEPICKFVAKPFDVEQLTAVMHSCKELC